MNEQVRRRYLDAVKLDLVGPIGGEHESLELRSGSSPRDVYVTGLIGPAGVLVDSEFQDRDGDPLTEEAGDSDPGDAVSMASRRGPTSIGLSFAMTITGKNPTIRVRASGGFYVGGEKQGTSSMRTWERRPFEQEMEIDISDVEGHSRIPLGGEVPLEWYIRRVDVGGRTQVTLVLCNNSPEVDRILIERNTLYQSAIEVQVQQDCLFAPRPVQGAFHNQGLDEDTRANALLYRNRQEWAVGHGCAATWSFGGSSDANDPDELPTSLSTTWLPEQLVEAMSPSGDPCFSRQSKDVTGDESAAFDARVLAGASGPDDLRRLLSVIPDAYEAWLEQQVNGANLEPQSTHSDTLAAHVERAHSMIARMREGIDLLTSNPLAHRAFLLAQEAMIMQLGWAQGKLLADQDSVRLIWRPFQLGFMLLTTAGIVGGTPAAPHKDRDIMDLLWFPTGGGKTEAYLGLSAFTIFYRRLRENASGTTQDGAGVTVLMRYTLRLLTIQQFERAARLIIACDTLRGTLSQELGEEQVSIGLWVGAAATPNTLEKARLNEHDKTQQLTSCPVCGDPGSLRWDVQAGNGTHDFNVACINPRCDRGNAQASDHLPVYTIDEMIYRIRPTLVIGTVDKFAQIVRKGEAGALLRNEKYLPPELIIQDELHLISGPLGTVTGLYEAAIDRICSVGNRTPKIVGSTATIRRAEDQVRALFDRDVCQFPPPILDAENSCFAVVDRALPGRLYVGMSTAGKSPKFSLQHLSGALLQRASSSEHILTTETEQDPYWTQLIYFNALRELGGALVMVHDDIPMTMSMLAGMHGVSPRAELEHLELSSRLGAIDIPEAIAALGKRVPEQNYDVVLATNMISVGVDISRLGLMIVNGQPKGMSEYIQASSRVGRGNLAGLVFSLYNSGRPRDRSHFESFRSWHQALYSSVEASSVTPFSARARERALHACIVAMARHVVSREDAALVGLHDSPDLSARARSALEALVDDLARRGAAAMAHVMGIQNEKRLEALEKDIKEDGIKFLDIWKNNPPTMYWNDRQPTNSLLISAEEAAATKWKGVARPTPNSMREVEPSVVVRVVNGLKTQTSRSQ